MPSPTPQSRSLPLTSAPSNHVESGRQSQHGEREGEDADADANAEEIAEATRPSDAADTEWWRRRLGSDGGSSAHIRMESPVRPPMPQRKSIRGVSAKNINEALRLARSREEQETLLGEHEEADDDGCYPPRKNSDPTVPNPHQGLPVYTTIHKIRRLVIASIDDPYSTDQLKSPRMNVAVVRPLVDYLYDPDDVSIVFCLLVNRVQFLREQSYQAHHQTVNLTRATLCELVASRILRRFDEDHEGRMGLLMLANVLVAGFEPFQNAPIDIARENRTELHWTIRWKLARPEYQRMLTALEVAIVSEAKAFLSTSACQKIVENVYRGRIIYTPTSFIDILPDHYKNRGITLYDPRKAPILNQYRLIVPRTRNVIEAVQFTILLALYIATMVSKARTTGPSHLKFTTMELIFDVYAIGWNLDEVASIFEHGWTVHTENLWSFLDLTFVLIFWAYFGVRMQALALDDHERAALAEQILSMGAPVLLPRLAFCLMSENMLFISLRAMMADFTFLTVLACWCFGGFILALAWLSEGQEGFLKHTVITISKWMLWIWFGLDGTGIQRSVEMHWLLGPILMITFAFLGNTLFLTILVAMLSNTYNTLSRNATAEIQFRRAVLTFEGVKSDAIFAYRPPFNVLALVFLLPLKFLLSPRWFHKVNITAIRILNAPILLLISWYERNYLWSKARHLSPSRRRTWLSMWERFGAHGDLQAVFDTDPPQEVLDELEDPEEVVSGFDENGELWPRRRSMSEVATSGVWGGGMSVFSRSRSRGVTRRRTGRAGSILPDPEGEAGEEV
ncbi:receptor-activated Ca2+-permeable cation channel [Lecanosticta acicola]|uniref:Receptor-activated Ca2+-permeable cation channel n=1 Tax=Lecanosticta acicola TaxID=111012 RepID=A0AAI9EDP3_9PEZI|nr:receptor-activated Ca2+-permeable cation channel [Lecanosticta acicola]